MLKNITTRALACSLWLACGLAVAAPAAAPAKPIELAANAPDSHVVARGDTLWDISARFLKSPWQWTELWQLNREQIANPHLIYPGDVVYLDRSGTQPRLRLGRPVGTAASAAAAVGTASDAGTEPTVRLEPRVRTSALSGGPVPTLNLAAVEAFLTRPLIVDEQGLKTHPRILDTQDGRLYLSRGELAYVRGMDDPSVREWQVYRPAKPLLDPATRQPLGWETLFVGSAQLVRDGDPATIRITSNNEEIGQGDRLMPAVPVVLPTLAPRPPDYPVEGRIVSVYRGVASVGKNNVVAVSLGSEQGLEVGHVLAVQSTGRVVPDREMKSKEMVRLPNENIGQLVIFRVFDRIAYGLVVAASEAISVGATVVNP